MQIEGIRCLFGTLKDSTRNIYSHGRAKGDRVKPVALLCLISKKITMYWISNKVFVYKKRLQMVPISFKWFIWFLGVLAGGSAAYIYLNIPTLQKMAIEQPYSIEVVNIALAEEKKPVERDLADYIWLKESTRGKYNFSKCEAIGKINGIGYGIPGDGTYTCFDSHEDEMIALKGWIVAKKAKGLTEIEMLCLYSGGNYSECKD